MSFFSPLICSSLACCSFSSQVVEARLQDLHRGIAVAVLRSLVLARHDDARRQVREADGRVRDVDVLAAGAARAIRVDAKVLLRDVDVDVVRQLRPDEHRRERRVPALRLIERRDAHEPVDAGLGRQQPERVVADHHHRGALDAGLVARLVVDQLALEAAAIAPAHVHLQQHLGPVLRLGAAGAWMDGHDGVDAIVLAAEHLARLGKLDVALEVVQALEEIRFDRLARPGPLDEDAEVVAAARQRLGERQLVFDAASALQQLLRLGLVLPEVRLGNARLYAIQFSAGASGVKDSSADRRCVSPDPGSALPARRERTPCSQAYQTPARRPPARSGSTTTTSSATESHATTSPVRE